MSSGKDIGGGPWAIQKDVPWPGVAMERSETLLGAFVIFKEVRKTFDGFIALVHMPPGGGARMIASAKAGEMELVIQPSCAAEVYAVLDSEKPLKAVWAAPDYSWLEDAPPLCPDGPAQAGLEPVATIPIPLAVFEAYKSLATMDHWETIQGALLFKRLHLKMIAPHPLSADDQLDLARTEKVAADITEIVEFMRESRP